MAEFGTASTQLSDPQGQGTAPVAAVHEQVSSTSMLPIVGEIVDVFAKGLKQNAKEEAEKRKNAVIGEYINNETVYGSAFSSGQWNASQSSASSRANYTKFIAAYPEYADEIAKARTTVVAGTEAGEAVKQHEREQQLHEEDKKQASGRGYTFYPGMSQEVINKTIDASKNGIRIEKQYEQYRLQKGEERADAAETRAGGTYQIMLDDRVAQDRVVKGAQEILNQNFDLVDATTKDLQKNMLSGTMTPEAAMAVHTTNISRIKAGLLASAEKYPEKVAPYIKLFDDMDANIRTRLDPKVKTADERKMLEDQYAILVTKGKVAAISVPEIKDAVIKTSLFPGDTMVQLSITPAIQKWTLAGSGVDPKLPAPPQAVGTPDDTQIFKITTKAINDLQSGKVLKDSIPAATQEATNLVNTLLKQTTSVEGGIDPRALKTASAFYASTEFGRMSVAGQVDKQTAANAQHVFQVKYDPAVKQAIIGVLDKEITPGVPLAHQVDVKVIGSNVTFVPKYDTPKSVGEALQNLIPTGLKNIDIQTNTAELKNAAAGLNQLIRMHAHLEGTTDYAKYWEENKHMLMPGYFMEGVKEGTVRNGYKFLGGDARNPKNWEQQANGK